MNRQQLCPPLMHRVQFCIMRCLCKQADAHPNLDSVLPQAEIRNKELQALGVGVKVVAVGKKAQVYFKRRKDRFDVVGELRSCRTSGCVQLNSRVKLGNGPHALQGSSCMPVFLALRVLWLLMQQ